MKSINSNLSGNMSEHNLDEFLILNVDDTEAARYAKSKILTRVGFNVIDVSNGTEALEKAKQLLPNLILLDTKLPDINGFDVCRQLKADPVTQHISILQTSASFITSGDKITALDGGADNYLFEPIEPEELISNIKALIRLNLAERALNEINRKKDVFLATLAHELRNPLGPIRNSLMLLKISQNLTPKHQQLLNVISRQTDQMVRLVDDLLDVSRISLGKILLQPCSLDVDEFIEGAIESSSSMIQARGHTLDVAINANGLYVHGDKVRLVQIVSNLLNNAAKFTPRDGLISLSVDQENDFVSIKITDNGIGLSKQDLNTIFELFVQHGRVEDRAQEGLGIGLSLVKNLIELHGGEISVESPGLGLGSTFNIKLKLINAPKIDVKPTTDAVNQVVLTKILVIDDNVDAADSLVDLLGMFGHEVRSAHSGQAGIEVASTFLPNVVFLDIGLPDMLGYEAANLLRKNEQHKDCYLIALTGYGTDNDKQLAINSGFDFHITKPMNLNKIKFLNLGF